MVSATIRIPDYLTGYTGKTPHLPTVPWVIEALVLLEGECNRPVMSRLAVATAPRRAMIFAALAALKVDNTARTAVAELSPAELADWLLEADLREIASICFGDDCPGVAGVIEKAVEPLNDPADYLWLAKTMRCETDRTRRQALCLRHARHVTSDLIGVLKALRNRLLRPAIVSGIGTADRAAHIEALVNHLCQAAPMLPDHVIAQSLEMGGLADLFGMASKMILRHGVALAGGLDDCGDFVFLRSGEDYRRYGDRYACCLGDITQGHALSAAFGVKAVAEWRHGKVLAVLSLMSDGGDQPVWVCDRLWGPANSKVPDDVALIVTKALRRRGILTLSTTAPAHIPADLLEKYVDREDYLTLLFRQLGE